MISGVTQEDTSTGSGAEFVSGGGCLVGEAQAAKHPEVSVVRWSTQEPLERCHWRRGVAWAPVEKVSGSGKRFSPKGKWHASVQKKAAHTIIQGADDAFCLAIPSRGIWIGKAKGDAVRGEVLTNNSVVKLFAVVGLKRNEG